MCYPWRSDWNWVNLLDEWFCQLQSYLYRVRSFRHNLLLFGCRAGPKQISIKPPLLQEDSKLRLVPGPLQKFFQASQNIKNQDSSVESDLLKNRFQSRWLYHLRRVSAMDQILYCLRAEFWGGLLQQRWWWRMWRRHRRKINLTN